MKVSLYDDLSTGEEIYSIPRTAEKNRTARHRASFAITGGNKWLKEEQVLRIVRQVAQAFAVADFSPLEISFLQAVINEELRRLRHVAHVTGELRLRH